MFDLDYADQLTLKNSDGMVIDSVTWQETDCPVGSSLARFPDQSGPFQSSHQPTPNETNEEPEEGPRCGDQICDSNEDCSSCEADCGTCVACPTELFISEYIEGSGSNKALELFNGTGSSVDLSQYQIWGITNGGVWGESITELQGFLGNGETLVLCHRNIDPEYTEFCDALYSTNPVNFNGDDAVGLARQIDGEFRLIDQLGEEGEDIGEGWTVDGISYATKNHTLIRDPQASASTNWSSSAQSDWLVYDQDYFVSLGDHTYANQSCVE